jgi:hypothetical protein
MGVPIPYNNIGCLIPEFLGGHLHTAVMDNIHQLWRYVMHLQGLQ